MSDRKRPPKRRPLILTARFEIVFKPEHTLAIKLAAERQGVSAGEYIRRATAAALKRDGIDLGDAAQRPRKRKEPTVLPSPGSWA